jgi:two-component system, LuxR family, sensor kinase FixL
MFGRMPGMSFGIGNGRSALGEADDDALLALEAAGVGIWRFDVEANVIALSAKARELLGTDRGSLEHSTFLDFLHPDDRDLADHALRDGFEAGSEHDVEVRTASAAHGHRRLWLRGRRLPAPGGRCDIRGIVIDVPFRDTAESASYRLATIVASSDDAIIGKTLESSPIGTAALKRSSATRPKR